MLIFPSQKAHCAPRAFIIVAIETSYSWSGGKTADGHSKPTRRAHTCRHTLQTRPTKAIAVLVNTSGKLSFSVPLTVNYGLYLSCGGLTCFHIIHYIRLTICRSYICSISAPELSRLSTAWAALIRRLNKSARISQPGGLHNVLTRWVHAEHLY